MACTYVHVVGDGRAYQGAAEVVGVVVLPASQNDWVRVYDGLDSTSGEKVFEVQVSGNATQDVVIPGGVRFSHGVYVDAKETTTEVTVFFNPLEL